MDKDRDSGGPFHTQGGIEEGLYKTKPPKFYGVN